MNQSHLLKFILVGNAGVGKTSIINRLSRNEFDPDVTTTVGVDYVEHPLSVNGEDFKLIIWDTAGQEKYFSIIKNYFRKSVGVIIVYDIENRSSYEKIPYWLNAVKTEANPGCVGILVGNKTDKSATREVSREEAEKYAAENDILYIETSALTNENVKEAFEKVTEKICQKIQSGEIVQETNFDKKSEDNKEETKESSCC